MAILEAVLVVATLGAAPAAEKQCDVTEVTPIGKINQGGYEFEYQSGWGKDCIIYRIRNTRTGPLTPAIWREHRAADSQHLLTAILDAGDADRWREAVHITSEPPMKAPTHLGFGANSDEHKGTAVAFRSAGMSEDPPSIFTTILRMFTEVDKKPRVSTGVRATSKMSGDKAPFTLEYTLESLDPEKAITVIRAGEKPAREGLSIAWPAASSRPFLAALEREADKRLTPDRRTLTVTIKAEAVQIYRNRPLALMDSEGRSVIASSATTFVAVEPRR